MPRDRVPRPEFPGWASGLAPAHTGEVDLSGDNAARRNETRWRAVRAFADAYLPQLIGHLRAGLPAPPVRITVASPRTRPGRAVLSDRGVDASGRRAADLRHAF